MSLPSGDNDILGNFIEQQVVPIPEAVVSLIPHLFFRDDYLLLFVKVFYYVQEVLKALACIEFLEVAGDDRVATLKSTKLRRDENCVPILDFSY